MHRWLPILMVVYLGPRMVLSQDDFKWSWQDDGKGGAVKSSGGKSAPQTGAQSRKAAGVDPAAYAQLLKQNQALRQKVEDAEKRKDSIEQANAKLEKEVKGMEQRISRMVSLIGELKKEKTGVEGNLDKVVNLESRLAEAEKGKAHLVKELAALRVRERQLQGQMKRRQEEAKPEGPGAFHEPKIRVGSDLFRELEKENALLKQKLVKIEGKRMKAVKERDKILAKDEKADRKIQDAMDEQRKLKRKVADQEVQDREQRRLIKKLMKQIPNMEKELAGLKVNVTKKKTLLEETEDQLETMKVELERREHRMVKAERMARLLQKSRERVQKANLGEKRDMHYNMAVIYSKEDRHKDAEREYLNALRIDPTDADVHYNLGILYEEELRSRRKAARHYKKYLELNPYAPDADKVRGWVMRFDVE